VVRAGRQVEEAVALHQRDTDPGREAVRLLDLAGLHPAAEVARRYPHELSGGMQQRVMLAIALAGRPSLLIADEPTTALDVTVQARVLRLIRDLRESLGMAVLLITHNLGLAAGFADRIAVMYAGRIVETGPVRTVMQAPLHPYTRALLDAVPRLDDDGGRREGIPGRVPPPAAYPPGCRFHPRCPVAVASCREQEAPEVRREPDHTAACWVAGNGGAGDA
jgi:oligopeptide/dipeptide ABC transporter ATP-binding protein